MFIEHLFDLVEKTRTQSDETFNYSVIKLIVRTIVLFDESELIGRADIIERAIHGGVATPEHTTAQF